MKTIKKIIGTARSLSNSGPEFSRLGADGLIELAGDIDLEFDIVESPKDMLGNPNEGELIRLYMKYWGG